MDGEPPPHFLSLCVCLSHKYTGIRKDYSEQTIEKGFFLRETKVCSAKSWNASCDWRNKCLWREGEETLVTEDTQETHVYIYILAYNSVQIVTIY